MICLSMICRNESAVIERCLRSVLGFVDKAVIVDTGSTDDTRDKIWNFCKENGIDLRLYERPWVNFEKNRNQALDLAREQCSGFDDWILFMDADQELVGDRTYKDAARRSLARPELAGASLWVENKGLRYTLQKLIPAWQHKWAWKGVTHECLTRSDDDHSPISILTDIKIIEHGDGADGKSGKKAKRDIELLEESDLDDPRNVFYLAWAYMDAGRHGDALVHYRKRTKMAGSEEERWYAALQYATMLEHMDIAPNIIDAYLKAWGQRIHRAEPLIRLARFMRQQKRFAEGYLFARDAFSVRETNDQLFVEETRWQALDEMATNAYYVPELENAGAACIEILIRESQFPESDRARIMSNLGFWKEKMAKKEKAA